MQAEQGNTGGYNTLNRYVHPLRSLDAADRQAITAAGTGCAAALDAQHYRAQHPPIGEATAPRAAFVDAHSF